MATQATAVVVAGDDHGGYTSRHSGEGGTGKEHGKRHPTIGSNVVIGAGAIILGAIHIGDNSRVGAGAVVTKSVPPDTTVVGNPSWIIRREGRKLAPLEHGSLPDPVHRAFDELNQSLRLQDQEIKLANLK